MAVNLTDYSKTAAQRSWGAGWPSCAGAKAAGTAVVAADVSGAKVSVHKRIARLVDLLLDATEKRHGYLLKPAQCGGYNCRPIAGTSSPSNHSWGLAVDLNWNENTYNSTGRHTLPTAVARMWNRYGFAWGGDYTGAKHDWMHLEFMGSPADADAMTALALVELAGTVPQSPAPASAGAAGLPSLEFGQTSPAVASLQRFLNAYNWRPALPLLVADGAYGAKTVAVLKSAQAQMGVTGGDGRNVGPQTKAALWSRGWRG